MPRRVYLVSALCGIAWHAIVALLIAPDLPMLLWGLPAGLAAGLCAGAWTIRSRLGRYGRESWLDAGLTYYGAVGVYATSLAVTELLMDALLGRRPTGSLEAYLIAALVYGSLWGVVLLPLSLSTRRIVWRSYCNAAPGAGRRN